MGTYISGPYVMGDGEGWYVGRVAPIKMKKLEAQESLAICQKMKQLIN